MKDRVQISEEFLEDIVGGQITYTWNGTSGTIGINGNNPFILVNKQGFIDYYNENRGKKKDSEILQHLIDVGIAKKR